MFLAIAVDNLANAQELTAAEEADEKAQEEVSENSSLLDEQMVTDCPPALSLQAPAALVVWSSR